MRTVKYIVLALIALCLLTIGFANRDPVTLTLLPGELVPFTKFNLAATLPLFVVVLGSVGVGLLIGFFWEWVRESRHRNDAAAQRRERAVLAAEVKKMKAAQGEHKDDVLALLDQAETAR